MIGESPNLPGYFQVHPDVRELDHDAAGEFDRVLVVLEGTDRTGAEPASVHDAGVQLDFPQQIGQTRVAHAVIVGVRLDRFDARDDGVDRGATAPQNVD